MKDCKKCLKSLPADRFGKNSRLKDGLQSWCKDCDKKIKQTYPSQQKDISYARTQAWKHSNRERARELGRKSQKATYENRGRAYRREYYLLHREYYLAYGKNWKDENRERVKESAQEWASNNPDKVALKSRRYRANKHNAQGSHTLAEWLILCEQHDFVCLRCKRKIVLTVDHIRPLSKGGSDSIENLQPLCHSCNSWKKDKEIDYRDTASES